MIRHANASSALVRIAAQPDTLTIEVTDNGRARPAAVTPGHGLRGMAERAAAVGGQLDVGPQAQGGWRVSAELPLNGNRRR